ncbi:MAG: adenosylcobinamide-GDP ribazoletransferase [Geminicoccaceae bacterium]|nr:adenosylcobinamide-GDP ribazoletransferase [Geminicoccaceae bacterium]
MPLHEIEVALATLTRFPSRLRTAPRPQQIASAVPWFPLAGAAVGAAAATVYFFAGVLGTPGLSAVLFALATQVLATGALHEVGLARTIEALAALAPSSPTERERRGLFLAVIALVLLLLARTAALTSFWSPWSFAAALVAASAFSRAVFPVALLLAPASVALRPARGRVLSGLGLGFAIALALLPPLTALEATVWAASAAAATALYLAHRAGGCDTDGASAVQQAAELAFLLALAAEGWPPSE